MNSTVCIDPSISRGEGRRRLYDGQLFVNPSRKSSLAFINFARQLMEEAFAPMDPETAQRQMPVEQRAETLGEYLRQDALQHRLQAREHRPCRSDARCAENGRTVHGTTMRDYLRGTDFSHVPDELLALCDDDTASEGELVYQHRARA